MKLETALMFRRCSLLRTLLLGVISLFAVQGSDAATRWETEGEERLSLNGEWFFRADPEGVSEKEEWYDSETNGW